MPGFAPGIHIVKARHDKNVHCRGLERYDAVPQPAPTEQNSSVGRDTVVYGAGIIVPSAAAIGD
jgi:hypothetical protein